jgi:hypothetical protein
MTSICPAGHTSTSDDYCDVCGMPIQAAATGPAAPPPPTDLPAQGPAGQVCPNCATQNVVDALFCEACGYDFTTGTMPRSAAVDQAAATPASAAGMDASNGAPAPLSPPDDISEAGLPGQAGAPQPEGNISAEVPLNWVAEVWIDPAWYEAQDSPDELPSPGLPAVVPLRNKSVLIGRKSRSRNINPDIDCEPDTGTSRRQAQLTTDGTRWWVEDLESSNGTFVGAASEPLPEDPIPVGPKRELKGDDRIYVGAWTRLVIREATDDERATLG